MAAPEMDVTVTGSLTVDGDVVGRSTLFMDSFSRLSSLAVVGLVSASGNVESAQQVVAQSGLVSRGDATVATTLTVQGAAGLGPTTVAGALTATGTLTATAGVVESCLQVFQDVDVGAHVVSQPQVCLADWSVEDPEGAQIPAAVAALGTDAGGTVTLTVASGSHQVADTTRFTLLYGVSYGPGQTSFAVAGPSAGAWGSLRLAATAGPEAVEITCVSGTGPATLTPGSPLVLTYLAAGGASAG